MPKIKYVPIVTVGLVVVGFVVGVIGSSFLTNWLKYDSYDRSKFIDSDTYQAVFLTNDQIYFGRLKNISSDYLILSDVYYVKINESGAGQLVKLGVGEPHGPKDEMIVNQDQVLFWENMRLDSQVVKTIQSIQQQK
ncbi:MAG: hypothetical protein A2651_03365 [Candidatus Yanofskybacteria bacterium RIFCSPHIGHO2_01_FULL_42_12]|uniref:Uncharacterized protein n=1 Tax=Candidatus Yanofskybacteria bacterium RIFCSPLOWO2_01_FULL_42_49 TaxID=1802694 RepID=A0A1F8GCK7_9BACT|nr:MAG: hypothetical protein A2651_03365 [Candidatus Yanofskybacteria bacterium RIFCSPHIGHO2_01_FULL_42_12]OGN22199.1 MAG: hypothetical protein A2918_03500 [Candidatus Yanofskybacteria bacterium RIFCSPLOWO2_01_FULL_42_49]